MNADCRIFCGGSFCFDCRDKGYEAMAADDYRAKLLGSVDALLIPNNNDGVRINDSVYYVGPFYFETESMDAKDIISCEKRMIETSTDVIFILDEAGCPGTITEMMYANSLNKKLHLYYVTRSDEAETESDLHTPCWYPILFCQLTNRLVQIYPCDSRKDAERQIAELVSKINCQK